MWRYANKNSLVIPKILQSPNAQKIKGLNTWPAIELKSSCQFLSLLEILLEFFLDFAWVLSFFGLEFFSECPKNKPGYSFTLSTCIVIHTRPPTKAKKAPVQWIFWTIVEALSSMDLSPLAFINSWRPPGPWKEILTPNHRRLKALVEIPPLMLCFYYSLILTV